MADLTSTKTAKEKTADSARFSAEPDLLPVPYGLSGGILGLQHAAGNQAVSQLLQPIADERAQNEKGVLPVVQDVLHSGSGQPLESGTREAMEARFGANFSRVRVHHDPQAADAAVAENATAYTMGNHIFFGSGQYDPSTSTGQHLLAHELAHVVQQSRHGPEVGGPSDASLEQGANHAADALSTGNGNISVHQASAVRISRSAKGTPSSTAPSPMPARYQVSETILPNGRVRVRVWGIAGDAIDRPGLEKKYPLPGDIGLMGSIAGTWLARMQRVQRRESSTRQKHLT